jgi:cytochrome c-type biogenesis protein
VVILDSSLFLGGSAIAAVVAGSIALFAPCCISVMLPAYFASSFQNRRLLTAMTFLFAAGVATVILPIALGASALRQLFLDEHTPIYVAGGLLMLALGAYTLLGGRMSLPMPGRRIQRGGPLGVYGLGVFSGVASACCAPVLAGVVALSGMASSFTVALGLGAAYTFGMVAPLFALALLWERRDWTSSRLFRPRTFTYRLGPLQRSVTGTNLASGLLLGLIGIATIWLGIAGDAMPAASDWQATFVVRLQALGAAVTDALSWLPAWAGAVVVGTIVAGLALRASRQMRQRAIDQQGASVPHDDSEECHEQQV